MLFSVTGGRELDDSLFFRSQSYITEHRYLELIIYSFDGQNQLPHKFSSVTFWAPIWGFFLKGPPPTNNIVLQQRFHNIEGKLGNVVKLSCCNVIQESYTNVAAKRCMKTSPPLGKVGTHNFRLGITVTIFTTLWQPFWEFTELRCCKRCHTVLLCITSAIWENSRRSEHVLDVDGVIIDAHTISLADFMFHFR